MKETKGMKDTAKQTTADNTREETRAINLQDDLRLTLIGTLNTIHNEWDRIVDYTGPHAPQGLLGKTIIVRSLGYNHRLIYLQSSDDYTPITA